VAKKITAWVMTFCSGLFSYGYVAIDTGKNSVMKDKSTTDDSIVQINRTLNKNPLLTGTHAMLR